MNKICVFYLVKKEFECLLTFGWKVRTKEVLRRRQKSRVWNQRKKEFSFTAKAEEDPSKVE